MAATKQFNSEDIIISPLEVNKSFTFSGSTQLTGSEVGIDRFLGSNTIEPTTTGYIDVRFQSSIYHSIKQLYYTNYISGSNGNTSNVNTASFNIDGTVSPPLSSSQTYQPSYYNYPQTDLSPYKFFPTASYTTFLKNAPGLYGTAVYGDAIYGLVNQTPRIGVMSIPKNLFGDYIQPKSIRINTDSGSYKDDGEGRLVRYNTTNSTEVYVGNVIYQHGMVVLTGGNRTTPIGIAGDVFGDSEYGAGFYGGRTIGNNDILDFVTGSNIEVKFSSSFGLYETQYKCTIGESEFNFTLNPSIISSSIDGSIYNFATSSFFDPYITCVGMYDNNKNLVAVGKFPRPIPTSRTTDTTILINIDRQ
tara:strand:+ start:2026 stop:3105 length:1080 start_codon:yes stop_codon:yes gene_type:complete